MRPTKEEVNLLIESLQKRMKIEEIAVYMDRSVACLWKWKAGRGLPNKGDFELLKRLEAKK